MRQQITIPGGGITELKQAPDPASLRVRRLGHGDVVDVAEPQPPIPAGSPGAAADWRFASHDRGGAIVEGWVETKFLGAVGDAPPIALIPSTFVRACVRAELDITAGGRPEEYVAADYLIAWAQLMSGMENKPSDPALGNAGGPFMLTADDWNEYLAEVDPASGATAAWRNTPALHVGPAVYCVTRDVKRFRNQMAPVGEEGDPYVVTFLNALHIKMLGANVATKIAKIVAERTDTQGLESILIEAFPVEAERAILVERWAEYLKDGANIETVGGFYRKTNQALNLRFTHAFGLIRDHFPEVIPEPGDLGGAAPWFPKAEEQLAEWKAGDFTESDAAGLDKIKLYFRSTDHPPVNSAVAWCGAFVAHCLKEGGDPGAASVIRGAAGAANWISWGDTSLPLRMPENADHAIPKGAIVVFEPLAPRSTGHVAFFESLGSSNTINVLGGNQLDGRVSITAFNRGKIVSIRWLSTVGVNETSGDTTPVPGSPVNATRHDVDVLARTLFGEAVGEFGAGGQGDKAVQAVANVVINRMRARHRGKGTIAGVCLDPLQFSCWNGRGKRKLMGIKAGDLAECLRVAQDAAAGAFGDHTDGARHYHANYIAKPSWAHAGAITLRIGRHIFYKGVP